MFVVDNKIKHSALNYSALYRHDTSGILFTKNQEEIIENY